MLAALMQTMETWMARKEATKYNESNIYMREREREREREMMRLISMAIVVHCERKEHHK